MAWFATVIKLTTLCSASNCSAAQIRGPALAHETHQSTVVHMSSEAHHGDQETEREREREREGGGGGRGERENC